MKELRLPILCVLFVFGCRVLRPLGTDESSEGESDSVDSDTTPGSEDTAPGTDSATDFETCFTFNYPPYIEKPSPMNFLIVLDRSASMAELGPDGRSLYAMVDETVREWVLGANENTIYIKHFGLAVFPSLDCETTMPVDPVTQCSSIGEMQVPLGPDTESAIAAKLAELDPCGGSPLGDTLWWIAKRYLPSLTPSARTLETYIVLITAGPPNCNTALDVNACVSANAGGEAAVNPVECLDDVNATAAAAYLWDDRVAMFVIGVGDASNPDGPWGEGMTRLARAAGGSDYIPAPDAARLDEVFSMMSTVVADSWSCTLPVDWDAVPDEPSAAKACDKVSLTIHETAQDLYVQQVTESAACGDEDAWHWPGS